MTAVKLDMQQEQDRQGMEVLLGLLCNQGGEGKRKSMQKAD